MVIGAIACAGGSADAAVHRRAIEIAGEIHEVDLVFSIHLSADQLCGDAAEEPDALDVPVPFWNSKVSPPCRVSDV